MITGKELIEQIRSDRLSELDEGLVNAAALCMTNEELDSFYSVLNCNTTYHDIINNARRINDFKSEASANLMKRNHSVNELLMWFNNKRSRKVICARKELQQRFLFLSYDEQLVIIRSMLNGCKTDREWSYGILRKWWSEELLELVIKLWDDYHEEHCGWLVTRYGTIEQLRERISELSYNSNYYRLCKRLAPEPWFLIDKDKLRDAAEEDPDLNYLWIMSQTESGFSGTEAWEIIYKRIARTIKMVSTNLNPYDERYLDGSVILLQLNIYHNILENFYLTHIKGMYKMLASLLRIGQYKQVKEFLEWDQKLHFQFASDYSSHFDYLRRTPHRDREFVLDLFRKYMEFVKEQFPQEYRYLFDSNDLFQEELMFRDKNGNVWGFPREEDFTNETGIDLRGLSTQEKQKYYLDYLKKKLRNGVQINEDKRIISDEQKMQEWNRMQDEYPELATLVRGLDLVPMETFLELGQAQEGNIIRKEGQNSLLTVDDAPF